MFTPCRSNCVLPVFFLSLLGFASGQSSPTPIGIPGNTVATYSSTGAIIVVSVVDNHQKRLDRQAVVRITNRLTKVANWHATDENSEAGFPDLTTAYYDIAVSAFGYTTVHMEQAVGANNNSYHIRAVLEKDPSAIELEPRRAEDSPPKVRKNVHHAITDIKSSDLKGAQKKLESAYKIDPASTDVNFLLGYVHFQKGEFDPAEKFLSAAVAADPHNVPAFTLLGRAYLQRADKTDAQKAFESAVAGDPDYWTAHSLLANIYLEQKKFDEAYQQAQLAIEKGKGAGNDANVVLGQALAHLGKDSEAIQALKSYLHDEPKSAVGPQVLKLISELEARVAAHERNPQLQRAPLTSTVSVANLKSVEPTVATWEPPGIDDTKPSVAADVPCPLDDVLTRTGLQVKQFVDDLARFSAVEDLLHEDLDDLGKATSRETRKFNYLVSISSPVPDALITDEFRTGVSSLSDFPDAIETRGLPAMAFVFHPLIQPNFHMICEGLGQLNGQAMWLVHFLQQEGRPNRTRGYSVAGSYYRVDLKGRAWISASTFQVVRLETELVRPLPEIQLLSEHMTIEYGPVSFPQKQAELWLPKKAEIYFDFRRHRYFRRHSFDNFMLFSVDSEEKRHEPSVKTSSSGLDATPSQQ
jgi:tetratricopeptide (TPR) repeat protein